MVARGAIEVNPTIRLAEVGDAQAITAIYAPIVRDTWISFEIEPPTSQVMANRIESTLATHPWLSAEYEGQVVGYAYAGRHRERAAYRWSVDVSAYVRSDMRGVGIGRALYSVLLKVLRKQGFRSAFAGIALPNAASIALHETMGFELVGIYREVGFKHNLWRDVGWWQVGLGRGDTLPSEPVPFASIVDRWK